jgi:cytoskeleton-associated protein 5
MKMVGERPLNALLESLADVRKAKVMEAFEKATVKCKVGTGPAAAKVPPTKKAAPAKKVTAVLEDEPPKPAVAKPPLAKVAVCNITYYLYYLLSI